MRGIFGLALFAICSGIGTLAFAQEEPANSPERPEPSEALETVPEGTYLSTQRAWQNDEREVLLPMVDRRHEVDPMTGQSILWPTAYTAKAGTATYTNFFFVGNSLNYAITDGFTLGASFVLPSLGASHSQLTGRVRVNDGPNHIVTLIPVLHYQSEGETDNVTTSAWSTGAGVVADFYITNRLILGAGAHAHLTLAASTATVASAECVDRDSFLNGGCSDVQRDWRSFPSGGHWFALAGHAIYYIEDWLNVRGELFTGAVAGTFLGAEYIYGRETLAQRSARYEDGELALGIPYDSGVTLGLGTGLTVGPVGVQLSGYMYYWEDEVRLTPMFVGAISF